jgi:hypothetical protein
MTPLTEYGSAGAPPKMRKIVTSLNRLRIKGRFPACASDRIAPMIFHPKERTMMTLDDVIPTAKDLRTRLSLAEAERAVESARRKAAEEAEKKALLDQLSAPSGVSDEERMRRAGKIIERAASNGFTEVFIGRFPNQLFGDRGRAINQAEPGWEATLTGLPKEIYDFWLKYLRPRGYRLKFQVVDFAGGIPGDIGVTLSWG